MHFRAPRGIVVINTFSTCRGENAGQHQQPLLSAGNEVGHQWKRGLEKKEGTGNTQARQQELASERRNFQQHPPPRAAAAAPLPWGLPRGRLRAPGPVGRVRAGRWPPPAARRKRKRCRARRKCRCPAPAAPGPAAAARGRPGRSAAAAP